MRLKLVIVAVAVLVVVSAWQAPAKDRPVVRKEAPAGATDLVRHGEYLVNNVAHCVGCHTPRDATGKLDRSQLLQGAMVPVVPKQKTTNWAAMAPDITSSGLAGKLSEADIVKFLMTGVDPAGSHARPCRNSASTTGTPVRSPST
jgi:mono/diheme cytochrome c family protein